VIAARIAGHRSVIVEEKEGKKKVVGFLYAS
jgi:hypothetical protein